MFWVLYEGVLGVVGVYQGNRVGSIFWVFSRLAVLG